MSRKGAEQATTHNARNSIHYLPLIRATTLTATLWTFHLLAYAQKFAYAQRKEKKRRYNNNRNNQLQAQQQCQSVKQGASQPASQPYLLAAYVIFKCCCTALQKCRNKSVCVNLKGPKRYAMQKSKNNTQGRKSANTTHNCKSTTQTVLRALQQCACVILMAALRFFALNRGPQH